MRLGGDANVLAAFSRKSQLACTGGPINGYAVHTRTRKAALWSALCDALVVSCAGCLTENELSRAQATTEPFVRSGHTKRANPGTGRRTEKEKWRHLWGGLWGENSSAQKFESRQRSMADDGSAHLWL
jgi:hypothetical protein